MKNICLFLIKSVSICLLFYFLFGISKGIYQNKKDIKHLNLKIQEEESARKNLLILEKNMEKRIDNLKNPKEVEKIARETLNMKKSGEEIYRIIKK